MDRNRSPIVPMLVVSIWGSLYIASGIVLKEISAFLLLFLRFSVSSVVLFALGRRKFLKIHREDIWLFLLIGFVGYFLSNAALMLGIQYSTGSFSSLINATTPILVTLFALIILREKPHRNEILSLALSITGAVIVIGSPNQMPSFFGIFCCLLSVFLWSFITIFISRLTVRYPALQVTCICMGIAAVFALPTSIVYYRLSGEAIHITSRLILPILYICLICTALSHFVWNKALGKLGAAYCASFYPLQPIVSVFLGVLLLDEPLTMPFIIGLVLIIAAMFVHRLKPTDKMNRFRNVLQKRGLLHPGALFRPRHL